MWESTLQNINPYILAIIGIECHSTIEIVVLTNKIPSKHSLKFALDNHCPLIMVSSPSGKIYLEVQSIYLL